MYYADVHIHRFIVALCAFAVPFLAPVGEVSGGIEDWQLSEVLTSVGGDTRIRYVELYNDVGGCFFASSRVVVYDVDGQSIGSTPVAITTTCYEPGSYFLLATPEANAALGMSADHLGLPALPVDIAQVCFTSTSTRYDCVRWGAVNTPVTDLLGSADLSSTTPALDNESIARISTTHVIVDDWAGRLPTPGGDNDGVVWMPPDAGPTPDAGPAPDAGPTGPDAGPFDADAGSTNRDAGPTAIDARTADARNQRYLDLDPAGGATCGCRVGRRPEPRGLGLGLVCALGASLLLRRRGQRGSRA